MTAKEDEEDEEKEVGRYLLERAVHAPAAGQVVIHHVWVRPTEAAQTKRGGAFHEFVTASNHVDEGQPVKDTLPELVAVLNWVELSTKVFGSEQKSLSACRRDDGDRERRAQGSREPHDTLTD